MNGFEQFPHVMWSVALLAALWYVVFWLYPDYQVDRYRQEMFALRDRLFDEALEGLVSFDHPAYGLLRGTINGFIRFAHRMSLPDVIILMLITKREDRCAHDEYSFSARLERCLKDLPPHARERLTQLRRDMAHFTLSYLFKKSVFMWTISRVAVFVALPLILCFHAKDLVKAWVAKFTESPMNGIESAAMAEGAS